MPDLVDYVACRICMDSKGSYVSLFSNDLSTKVKELANVQVEKNDGLPECICSECEQDLEKCYEFRIKVQTSDKKFRENINMSEVDIEECNIKEESYMDDGDSDNVDDKDSDRMEDDHYDDETETIQKDAEETGVAETDPLNHVVVVDEIERKGDVSKEVLKKDTVTEGPQVQEMEEVAFDSLTCLKEEAEIMDIDINQRDPLGPSSSVRRTEQQRTNPNCMSTLSSSGDAYTKNQFVLETKKQPIVSKQTNSQVIFPENPQKPSSLPSSCIGNELKMGEKEQSQGFILIPHSCLDTGLLIHCVPGTQLKDTLSQSCVDSQDDNHLSKKTPFHDIQGEKTIFYGAETSAQTNQDKKTDMTASSSTLENSVSSKVRGVNKSVRVSSTTNSMIPSTAQQSQTECDADTKEEYFCSVCNMDFGFPDRLDEHKKGKEFICRSCTVIFTKHQDLEAHFYSHRKFTCDVCKKCFHVQSDLLHHKNTVTSCKRSEIIKCRYCRYRFVHESSLLTHIKVKHPNAESRPFNCNICDSSFKCEATLREHFKSCHTVYENVECEICHKILPGPLSLKTHVKNQHLQTESDKVCPVCSKVLASKNSLKLHMESHTGEEKACHICGAVIKGKWTLKQHIYHHENGKKYCSFCNLEFNSTTERNRHYRLKHGVLKSCICEICGKDIKTKEMKNHMLTHSDVKPFKCEVCGNSFKTKTVLKTHSAIHSGYRKYSCNNCGEAFRWKQTFDKHVLKCESSSNQTRKKN